MLRALAFLFLLGVLSTTLAQEVVVLVDGTRIEGTVTVSSAGVGVVTASGFRLFRREQVAAIEFTVPEPFPRAAGAVRPVGFSPQEAAVSPDGTLALVTNSGENSVSVIDLRTRGVLGTIAVGQGPNGIALSPDGSTAYVVELFEGDGAVSFVDVAGRQVVARVLTPFGPHFIAVSPDGSRLYVTSSGSNELSVVDVAQQAVVATIPVGNFPLGVDVTPDGSRVVVANADDGTLSIIATASNQVIATVSTGTSAFRVTVSPDGQLAYVSDTDAGEVAVVDLGSATVLSTISVGANPLQAALSPDGRYLWVAAANDNQVVALDTTTNRVVQRLDVDFFPVHVAVAGDLLVVSNFDANTVSIVDLSPSSVFISPVELVRGSSTTLTITGENIDLGTADLAVLFTVGGINDPTVSVTTPVPSGPSAVQTVEVAVGPNSPPGPRDVVVLSGRDTALLSGGVFITSSTPLAPAIVSVEPRQGHPGDPVTIVATDLSTTENTVLFGGAFADVSRVTVSPEGVVLEVTVPFDATTGIGIQTSDGASVLSDFIVLPSVTFVSPAGVAQGQTTRIEIDGGGLREVAQVEFRIDGVADPAVTATVVESNPSFVTVEVTASPEAAVGERQLVVITPFGEAAYAPEFDPPFMVIPAGSVALPTTITDSAGFEWDIQGDGDISNGSIDAYDGGLILSVDGENFPFSQFGQVSADGREVTLGPATLSNGLSVQRRVYISPTELLARFAEVLTNPGSADVTVQVTVQSNLGSDSFTNLVATSSGGTSLGPGDSYLITDDDDGMGDPTLLHLWAGASSAVQPVSASLDSDNLSFSYQVTIPAGGTVVILHFASQQPDQAAARAAAARLQEVIPADALAGLDAVLQAQVVNFNIAPVTPEPQPVAEPVPPAGKTEGGN